VKYLEGTPERVQDLAGLDDAEGAAAGGVAVAAGAVEPSLAAGLLELSALPDSDAGLLSLEALFSEAAAGFALP
jgi:hypothetical protein